MVMVASRFISSAKITARLATVDGASKAAALSGTVQASDVQASARMRRAFADSPLACSALARLVSADARRSSSVMDPGGRLGLVVQSGRGQRSRQVGQYASLPAWVGDGPSGGLGIGGRCGGAVAQSGCGQRCGSRVYCRGRSAHSQHRPGLSPP